MIALEFAVVLLLHTTTSLLYVCIASNVRTLHCCAHVGRGKTTFYIILLEYDYPQIPENPDKSLPRSSSNLTF